MKARKGIPHHLQLHAVKLTSQGLHAAFGAMSAATLGFLSRAGRAISTKGKSSLLPQEALDVLVACLSQLNSVRRIMPV